MIWPAVMFFGLLALALGALLLPSTPPMPPEAVVHRHRRRPWRRGRRRHGL
jgi:hypothetical protein